MESFVHLKELTDLLCSLISIESDKSELELARFVFKHLSARGFCTTIQTIPADSERANVIAKIGNPAGRRLLFEGHLDTVPAGDRWTVPPFCGTVQGGRVYGRGSADMKGGLAAMLAAAERVAAEKAILEKNQLILAFVCDEELQCQGIKHYLSSSAFEGADYAVIAEPTDLRICVCHRGSCHYKIAVHGISSHAARPEKGINSILQASKVLQCLAQLSAEMQGRIHERLDPPVLTPTMIHAGIQDNMVPDRCEIVVDARILPGETAESMIRLLRSKLNDLTRDDPAFSCDIETTKEVLGGELQTDSPLACAAAEVYRSLFPRPASFCGFDVTCEQTYLMQAGVPTIIFGPGDCKLAHTPDEYVEIDALQKAEQYFYELARTLLPV